METIKGGIKFNITRSSEKRDPGFETERNDCVVRALQEVTGVPYRDAHAYVSREFKRKQRRGVNVDKTLRRVEQEKATVFGYRVFVRQVEPKGLAYRRNVWGNVNQKAIYPTVADTLYKIRQGRWLLCSSRHAWAVIDGVIHDNGVTSDRTRVREIYQFIPSSQCEGNNQ